jgi:predicted anti-sigma-YlaC factor YlaD
MDHETCHSLLASLSEYIDGDADQFTCTEIERHLEGCENCRIVVDSLRKTVYLYQTASGPAETPQEVKERLFRCLDLDEFLGKSVEPET